MSAMLWLVGFAGAATVTSNADTGPGTLREAIANAVADEVIDFDVAEFPDGILTLIMLSTALPPITADGVQLDGRDAVLLDGVLLAAGDGLVVNAIGVGVFNLEIANMPDNGIIVLDGKDARIGEWQWPGGIGNAIDDRGNVVRDCGGWGIVVQGQAPLASGATIFGNEVRGNCAAATGTCAGIGVQSGPIGTSINSNFVSDTQGGGHGIAVRGGSAHQITTNIVGLTGGNQGHGILLAAATGETVSVDTISGNQIGNSGGAGILLGARVLPSVLEGNYVGVTSGGTAVPNAGDGIQVFGSDGHQLGTSENGNVISSNLGVGIRVHGVVGGSPSENLSILNNLVGLSPDGLLPMGNGGDGIRITGPVGSPSSHTASFNVVSDNGGHGVRIQADLVDLIGNFIGLDEPGTSGVGNTGHGVYLDGSDNWVYQHGTGSAAYPNLISSNGGDGVRVAGGSDNHVNDNWVGFNISQATAIGNAGDGIHLSEGSGHDVQRNKVAGSGGAGVAVVHADLLTAMNDVTLAQNRIQGNGLEGIVLDGAGVSSVVMTENEVWGNGLCAIQLRNNANGGLNAPQAPVITTYSATEINGTYTVPVGKVANTIEVFSSSDSEQERFLGAVALPVGGMFTLQLSDTAEVVGSGERVSATLTLSDGRTSGIEAWCQDGCVVSGGSCNDGIPCTLDACGGSGCISVVNPLQIGLACDDGNDCTTGSVCDANGVCGGGTDEPNGTVCNDGDACSSISECSAGQCSGESDVVCDDNLSCTAQKSCNAVNGCEVVPKPEGTRCEDGDLCTGAIRIWG